MNKKFISFVLTFLMVLGMFGGFESVFAYGERQSFIVELNIDNIRSGFQRAATKGDYASAKSISKSAIDSFVRQNGRVLRNVRITDRLGLLIPGFVMDATPEYANIIKNLPNVVNVYSNSTILAPSFNYDKNESNTPWGSDEVDTQMFDSRDIVGMDDALLSKYDGTGSALAIIDSNMDPSHSAFYLSDERNLFITHEKVNDMIRRGLLNARVNYTNTTNNKNKVPFGYHYPSGSTNLNPDREWAAHGQHVSGTVAGNTMQVNGRTWRGMAPNAQLFMMGVFEGKGTRTSNYVKAMEDAVVLGAKAANMSLGATKGIKGYEGDAVIKATDKGYIGNTNFVIAAGNEGDYQGDLSIDNPDFGTMATPACVTNAITVASLENKKMVVDALKVDGDRYGFTQGSYFNFSNGTYDIVDCGLGREEDLKDLNLYNKVALIERGEITFEQKVKNAQSKNAKGVIIYNNIDGMLGLQIEGVIIPVAAVNRETGRAILNSRSMQVTFDGSKASINNPSWGELSAFSNWGLTAGGFMKPDITAPGGHIYSTRTNVSGYEKDSFGDMSGTSMATPHVTGAVGVIREYLDNDSKFSGIENKAKLVKQILMNSATPHIDPVTKVQTSPRRQGAGVMNLKNATTLDFTVVDKDTEIASKFVGNVDDEITLNLKIKNYSNERKTLTPTVSATIEARDGKKILLRPDELFSRTYNEKKVTVPAKGEVLYTITFPIEHLEKIKDFTNGAFVEGFLEMRDQNGKKANFPFVSFKGKFETIPSIEKPVYEFDFSKENPTYWNYKFRNTTWYYYMTSLVTNSGRKSGFNQERIAGIKNFEEIDKNKNTENEPKPIFEPLVFSPNRDGFNDYFTLYLVGTRAADHNAEILDKDGRSVQNIKIGANVSNISFYPELDKWGYKGYIRAFKANLYGAKDGEYTLRIKSKAIKESTSFYPETYKDIKFRIDTKLPEITDASVSNNILNFKVKDDSFIKEVKYSTRSGKDELATNQGDLHSIDLTNKNINDITLKVMDGGYNTLTIPANKIVTNVPTPGVKGRLVVNIKKDGRDDPEVKYTVLNAKNEAVNDINALEIGKYTLRVDSYSPKYELVGEKEIPFEITSNKKEATIDLTLRKIVTKRVSIRVTNSFGLGKNDFYFVAKNVENGREFELRPQGYYSIYYSSDLPYGTYEFRLALENGIKDYSAEINPSSITIDSKTRSVYINAKLIKVQNEENGQVSFEIIESKDGIEVPYKGDIAIFDQNNNSYRNGENYKLKFGDYSFKLVDNWNIEGKYDESKSISTVRVSLNENNSDVKVKFVLVQKEAPKPTQKGKIEVKFYEEENGIQKELIDYLYAMDENYQFYYNNTPKEVLYGTYNLRLSSSWNRSGKYDEEKTITRKEVKVDELNSYNTVKFILVKKEAEKPVRTTGSVKIEVKVKDGDNLIDTDEITQVNGGYYNYQVGKTYDLRFGSYYFSLPYNWNRSGKYDSKNTITSYRVNISKDNPDAIVTFILVKKDAPKPKPQGSGSASWTYQDNSKRIKYYYRPICSLYRLENGRREKIYLNYNQMYYGNKITLQYGDYVYVMDDPIGYNNKWVNKEISFTIDENNNDFVAEFELVDR